MLFYSVVTPTFNRAELLEKYLASICAQDLPRDLFEVIIADNNSTDRTREVIQAHTQEYDFVRSVIETKQGTSNAKNSAVMLARAPYLVFFDDDVIVPQDHLSNAFKIIREHDPDILAGPVFPYYTVKKPWWFRDEYEIKRFEAKSGFSQKCRVTGANWIIRKDLFIALGGFDSRLGPVGTDSTGAYTGDERKLLDTYRVQTPASSQKVYYALECPVQHYVAPYKLQLGRHLGRRYTAGRTSALFRAEVWGAPWRRKDLLALSQNLVPNLVRALFHQIRNQGLASADLVEPFAMASYEIGVIVEGLSKHQGHPSK